MTQKPNYVLGLYRKALRFPFGRQMFSSFAARQAPYFRSVSPRVELLEPNKCQVLVRKRKRVQNHIGTMHIIAIADGLEMAMGFLAEASIPAHLRWIPKGMELQYPNKGETDILCTATVPADGWVPGDLPVTVVATDVNGQAVVTGTIFLWISEKPARK